MTEENHGNGKTKRPAKHENREIKAEVVSWLNRRTRMEIIAFGLMALSGVVFVIVGIFYQAHKKPMIYLFGVGFLLVDAAMCAFWLNKVQGDDSKVEQAVQPKGPSSPSKSTEEGKANVIAEPQRLLAGPVAMPRPTLEANNDESRGVDMAKKDKSVSQTMTVVTRDAEVSSTHILNNIRSLSVQR